MNKLSFLFAVILIFGGCQLIKPADTPDIGGLDDFNNTCNEDNKVCPDGTVVKRMGPNCEFESCPEFPQIAPELKFITIASSNIPNAAGIFSFSTKMPANWEAEATREIAALNFYDPAAPGDNNLEKSQIFMRYFSASSFLTLSTVNVFKRTETEIAGRPAVIYDIEKKSNIADFSDQPSWRNKRHTVTDIRTTDENPTTFYVIAKNPDTSQEIYDNFLNSFQLMEVKADLIEPVPEFKERITKKPFGIYITPAASPVQPERFQGYHTGIDVEYTDKPNEDIEVKTIASGNVLYSGKINGYGGVAVINHFIDESNYQVLYGHLDPASILQSGQSVLAGDTIGILGEGNAVETDGERKHLHLSIYTGQDVNFSGYVQKEADLKKWIDPLSLF